MSDKQGKIHMSGRQSSRTSEGSVTISGLTATEVEMFEAMLLNQLWLTVKEGRLEHTACKNALPDPIDDQEMLPFWRKTQSTQLALLDSFFLNNTRLKLSSPSILIQHLCGYGYSEDGYKFEARLLERYGFEIMRSRRGEDGKYSEIWFLPGLWSAKDDLKEYLKDIPEDKKIDAAVAFLCRKSSFGTLDIVVQRAAMVID